MWELHLTHCNRLFKKKLTFQKELFLQALLHFLLQPLIFLVPDIYDVYTPLPSDVIVQLSKVMKLPKTGVDDHWTLANNINAFSRIL